MSEYTEASLVERPIIKALRAQDYEYIPPSQHAALRDAPNEVLFKPHLRAALLQLNPGLTQADADSAVGQLAQITDNATWLARLRGDYSKQVQGQRQKRTLKLLDFANPANNHFVVTNQLKVHGAKNRIPDIVIYVNGIPLVVIEAKSPLNPSQGAYDAIHQIRSAEAEIPRLFHSNLFNIATNGTNCLYGATGAPPEFWSRWRDPWPRQADEFSDATALALYALLDRARLLDLLAHFVVFETRDTKTVKKICRYQQFRAVNKLVYRVCHGDPRQGLIWHTQGSGKSLTMVFAALKLKFHQGVDHPALTNPNLLVLTDRRDLHTQISGTFTACGLPNPQSAGSIQGLKDLVTDTAKGRTVLSTIFKFHWDDPRLVAKDPKVRQAAQTALQVAHSERWIIMADEAHRTQEKDLGAYLKAILPKAARFGFTGTPVQKNDLNTFQNFGAQGEAYLDKYGIDDAVADGATVPVRYMARQTQWHLHGKQLDILFDQWFATEPDEVVAELKRRGVTQGDLARFKPRIQTIAYDIWTHYQTHVAPDGFKAQICAVDRLACVAYKQALDAVIAQDLVKQGVPEADAKAQAAARSVCVYSAAQNDSQKDPLLVTYHVPGDEVTKTVIPNFQDPAHPLTFLIVCNKLLTGFDAPIEQALYLDNPLTDHNLLQAIARTNRRYGPTKQDGLVVDYIGVTAKLGKALSAYRSEDVAGALSDVDTLHDLLRTAHKQAMALLPEVPQNLTVKDQIAYAAKYLASPDYEDTWLKLQAKAHAFQKAYAALAPDERVLQYKADLKHVAAVLTYTRASLGEEELNWAEYSAKIRKMLAKHLEVTGLTTVIKQRDLSDQAFWDAFQAPPAEQQSAAVSVLNSLKKVAYEAAQTNPKQYASFAARISELIKAFNKGMLVAAEVLAKAKSVADGIQSEQHAHKASGLNERAYGIHAILKAHLGEDDPGGEDDPSDDEDDEQEGEDGEGQDGEDEGEGAGPTTGPKPKPLTPLQQAAQAIDALYSSDESAPPWWHKQPEQRKRLRRQVRLELKDLGLQGWKKAIPQAVDEYAVKRYKKP